MTLEWIPLDALEPHPENSNRMPDHLLAKLQAHLARTGRYEPLVVRPLGAGAPSRESSAGEGTRDLTVAARNGGAPGPRYQILNGHHRARALGALGHSHARCDVWEVDDDEARLLLATLNRLEGRDDPSRRAALVARLAEGRPPADLARLLPEPADALARLRKLAEPPPEPADPASAPPLPRAMTFFLSPDQEALVRKALRAAGVQVRGGCGDPPREILPPRPSRAEALAHLAAAYLEQTRSTR
jgi:hypothetical protein